MAALVVRRLATAALTLFLVTVLVFALIHVAPGDPLAGGQDEGPYRLSPESRAELRALYRLDEPLHVRYLAWLADLARGDLGRSFHDRRPVARKIGERIGVSFVLNACALALMLAVAVPIGAAAALRPGSRLDRWTALGGYALWAVPVFWAALILQIVFAVQLRWLPLAGLAGESAATLGPLRWLADRVAHLVLPVVCLSYGGVAYVTRFVRATLLENVAVESTLAARARGLSALAVLYRHGFRLAALPLLTLAGFLLPALVGGSVIVESIFAIPGLGRLFVDAAFQRDLPVLMGLTLLSGTATLAGIVAADVAYLVADPRLQRSVGDAR